MKTLVFKPTLLVGWFGWFMEFFNSEIVLKRDHCVVTQLECL
jgi:hypothetical protein